MPPFLLLPAECTTFICAWLGDAWEHYTNREHGE
jgi:hypothetical protein